MRYLDDLAKVCTVIIDQRTEYETQDFVVEVPGDLPATSTRHDITRAWYEIKRYLSGDHIDTITASGPLEIQIQGGIGIVSIQHEGEPHIVGVIQDKTPPL